MHLGGLRRRLWQPLHPAAHGRAVVVSSSASSKGSHLCINHS
jgi:hypothetical protein